MDERQNSREDVRSSVLTRAKVLVRGTRPGMLSGLFYTSGPNASLTWPTKELLQNGDGEAEIEL